jgi:heme exporter protein B
MMQALRPAWAVFLKDARSELRTRYALNALFLFAVTTLTIVLFAFQTAQIPAVVHAGMLWVLIFFAAMSGLSRAFITEEDRGTAMLLRLTTRPAPVFFGKLLFNSLLLLGLTAILSALYLMTVPGVTVGDPWGFAVALALGALGLASASTIIGAIIARANVRGTLYPVLSFPIVLPLLLTVIRATTVALAGEGAGSAADEVKVMVSYFVAVTTASYLLFEFIWQD